MVLTNLLLLAAAVSSQGPAPLPDAKVEYETVAVALPTAVKAIGETCKAPLFCGGEMQNEIVVMSVHGAPLLDTMNQLALATMGKWDKSKEGYTLVLDKAKAAQQERAEILARAKRIGEHLKKMFPELSAKFDEAYSKAAVARLQETQRAYDKSHRSEDYQAKIMAGRTNPSARLVGRLLATIDSTRIAAMGPLDRLVFSSLPTAAQIPFGKGGSQAIAQFVDEQGLWSETLSGIDEQAQSIPVTEYAYSSLWLHSLSESPAKVLLIVEPAQWTGAPVSSLKVAGASGRVLLDYRVETSSFMTPDDPSPDEIVPETPKEIAWSKKTLEYVADIKKASEKYGGGWRIRVGDVWAKRLANVEKEDPLSYGQSDVLLSIAHAEGRNFIAVPSDGIGRYEITMAISPGFTTPIKLLDMRLVRSEAKDSKWCMVRPVEPFRARSERVSRKALGPLLRSIAETGCVLIEPYCVFLAGSGANPTISLAGDLIRLLRSDPLSAGAEGARACGLKLYGSLSLYQRKAIREGGALIFGELAPNQQLLANQMVFGAHAAFEPIQREQMGPDGKPRRVYISAGATIALDPTEAFPSGRIPADARFTLQETTSPFLCGLPTPTGEPVLPPGSPEQLGRSAFGFEQRPPSDNSEFDYAMSYFRFGQRRAISVRLDASVDLASTSSCSEYPISWRAPAVPMESVPDGFRAGFQKGYQDARTQSEKQKPPPGPSPHGIRDSLRRDIGAR